MRIIQAFHAWGNITEIEEAHKNAILYSEPDNMRKVLKSRNIKLNKKVEQIRDEN